MREASTKWEDGFFGVVCCVRYACVYLTTGPGPGPGGHGRRGADGRETSALQVQVSSSVMTGRGRPST